MRRIILLAALIITLLLPVTAYAALPEFSGGVQNEFTYEEVVFLSGQPVKFTGTITVTERERSGETTIQYRFNLTSSEAGVNGKLNRQITYARIANPRGDKGQTIIETEIRGNPRETIEINGDKFELRDFQFSKSEVVDNRPAADFSSGTIIGRKVYDINGNQGRVIVEINGGSVGYENFWGETNTQVIDFTIDSTRGTGDNLTRWHGTVRSQASDSRTRNLSFHENAASLTSFEGGYIRVTRQEMVSRYDFNLPRLATDNNGENGNGANGSNIDNTRRNRGSISLALSMSPRVESLIVPKFRDVNGHWAESDIKKLYSLDVFDEVVQFFVPDIPMTRVEFTKAVIRACDIRLNGAAPQRATRQRNQPPEVSPFIDVPVDFKDYRYIKNAVEKGVISGMGPGIFGPQERLTRAQAITILIRVLGFENRAPNPGYFTSFSDDRQIPNWAKDSIYVAREIGLVVGDQHNNVNPNRVMTRAEASAMLVRFLSFLERDLQRDYRENIILFN